jgi:hypothetical protein
MKKLMFFIFFLCFYSLVFAYDGPLPPGASCPNVQCKSAHCDGFNNPWCGGGGTSGCVLYNAGGYAEWTEFYFYNCPSGGGTYCGFPEHHCKLTSVYGSDNLINCTPCDPHNPDDFPKPEGCEGAVWCTTGGGQCFETNPCGSNTLWNYHYCGCDCQLAHDPCQIIFSKTGANNWNTECKYGAQVVDWAWFDCSYEGETQVPNDFMLDSETGRFKYGVNFVINWYIYDFCDEDDFDCEISGYHVFWNSTDPAAIGVCMLGASFIAGEQFHNGETDTYNYQDNSSGPLLAEWYISGSKFYSFADRPILCNSSDPNWPYTCNYYAAEYYKVIWEGPVWGTETNWCFFNVDDNAPKLFDSGAGRSVEVESMKTGFKSLGYGGYEKRDN